MTEHLQIIFVHLLNDRSGSPKILKETIHAVCSRETQARLYIGSSGEGFLSDLAIPVDYYWYRRSTNRFFTLFNYLTSQLLLFFKLLCDKTIPKEMVIYINTLLPFGAALYGKLTRRRVIYHVHEISVTPAPLKSFLTGIARFTSSMNIYVSEAHKKALPLPGPPARRVYNALDVKFLDRAQSSLYSHLRGGCFTVLMIASLRDYKGIREFVKLASSTVEESALCFELVVNDEQDTIGHYFSELFSPPNLRVYPRTSDTASHYDGASLVVNLSRVDQCVETFGLTVLEAMAFGIPVIVPPVGGPTELVTDGIQGYWVDSRDSAALQSRVYQLYSDGDLCLRMSQACRNRAADFSPQVFAKSITNIVDQVSKLT